MPVPEGFVLMAPLRLDADADHADPLVAGQAPFLDGPGDPAARRRHRGEPGGVRAPPAGREALDRLVQPLVAGIYTADPNDLSLKATLPQFLAMEREHRSLILAGRSEAQLRGPRHVERQASGARYGMFVTLADGMDTLPKALAQALPAGTIRTNTAVRRISRNEPASPWLVELLDGPPLEADAVIVATEAHAAARFLDAEDPRLALQLRAIPYASSVIVNVAYRRDQISHPLDGFGAVVPAIEGRSILAVSFLSVKFPNRAPAGTVLLRVFIGGATHPEQFDLDDAAVTELVQRELGELIGASGEPLFVADRPPSAVDAPVHPRPPRPRRDHPPPSRQVLPALPGRHRLRRRRHPRLHSRRRDDRRRPARRPRRPGRLGRLT